MSWRILGLPQYKLTREQTERLREQDGLRVIDSDKPDPDSQWRLRRCRCGDPHPVYIRLDRGNEKPWAVRCMACGHMGEGKQIRHEAQICWNRECGT